MNEFVTGYGKLWPREVFRIQKKNRILINDEKKFHKPGIYVLYRNAIPYYVGKASKNVVYRLQDHANKPSDTYYHNWNFFAFFLMQTNFLDMVESILISAMPTANGAKTRFKEHLKLQKEIEKILKNRQ